MKSDYETNQKLQKGPATADLMYNSRIYYIFKSWLKHCYIDKTQMNMRLKLISAEPPTHINVQDAWVLTTYCECD